MKSPSKKPVKKLPASGRGTPLAFDALKTWQMKCPLKIFRIANKVTLTTAALRIGVSVTSLQFWESGTRLPKFDHFKELAKFMSKKPDTTTTEAKWRKWLAAKPKL